MVVRKMVSLAMGNMTKIITDNGDGTYTLENLTGKRDTKWVFKVGQQFEAKAMDDKMHKASACSYSSIF